jgi:D-alanine-D-alanine ligase
MRVLVLMHEEFVPPESIEGLTEDEIHPFKMEYDVLHALEALGHEVRSLPVKDELAPIRAAIDEFQPHIAFNLLRYFHDIAIYDAHVISYLELLKTPYTGSNPRGLLLANDKALSKKILAYHRIRVPSFHTFRRGSRISVPKRLKLPSIVKAVAEHASLGIAQASIVYDGSALKERVAFVHDRLGTDAIAEEYIEGREFTVGVLGNQRLTTFPVWELRFENLPPGTEPIATARVKTDFKYQEKLGVKTGRARDLSPAKETEIARMAKRIYRALELSGFARIDLRMDTEERVFTLEANPNPDICFGEDFAESAEMAGYDYEALIQKIVSLGRSYRPAWKTDE